MFTSFDENKFYQAIKDRNYDVLKVNTASAILDDPTFERGETKKVLEILEEQVPEIFEKYVILDYEERLNPENWDKRYFTKLTYWLQQNFAKERIEYIKEVGQVVHIDTAKEYNESLNTKYTSDNLKQSPKEVKTIQSPDKKSKAIINQPNKTTGSSTSKEISNQQKPDSKPMEDRKVNFPIARVILAVGALVLAGVLLFMILKK